MIEINIDQMCEEIIQPINITLDGKSYEIKDVSSEMLDRITTNTDTTFVGLATTLSELTGEQKETFMKIDIRKLVKTVRAVSEKLLEQVSENIPKN
jgi:hypothetical protein